MCACILQVAFVTRAGAMNSREDMDTGRNSSDYQKEGADGMFAKAVPGTDSTAPSTSPQGDVMKPTDPPLLPCTAARAPPSDLLSHLETTPPPSRRYPLVLESNGCGVRE
jgi:hypothetical protein